MKRLLIIAVALMALTGCGREFTLNITQFTAGLATLDAQYEMVVNVVAGSSASFTADERERLKRADQRFQQLSTASHALINDSGGVTQAVIKADQVRMLYGLARDSYVTVREVICPDTPLDNSVAPENCKRLATMRPGEQRTLISFDRDVQQTRIALEGILNASSGSDVTQVVSDLLTISATAARIARIGLI